MAIAAHGSLSFREISRDTLKFGKSVPLLPAAIAVPAKPQEKRVNYRRNVIMANSRKTALKILLKIEQEGAYSNIALNNGIKQDGLKGIEASFCSALVYGVLERKILLDFIIRQYTNIRLKKIETEVLEILRMAVLQLLFMDKIPESAAVNESVKLAKSMKLNKASGFINGVLRSMLREECRYKLPDKDKEKIRYYSVVYSVPEELVKLWISSYGEENAVCIMESTMGRAKLTVRVNTLKTDKAELKASLEKSGVLCSESNISENALLLADTGSVEAKEEYRKGLFHVQDIASQICCEVLAPESGMMVYDFCSAPGGKAFTMAQLMNGEGSIKAFDIYEHKVRLINNGAYRLGIKNISAEVRNALEKDDMPLADRVLCDVPCSGLGIIRRKPEIKYKENPGFKELPQLQYEILCNCSRYVRKGGRLVYSTCTLNPGENEMNVKRFLSEHLEFQPLNITLNSGIIKKIDNMGNAVTLLPGENNDGFFISLFERTC